MTKELVLRAAIIVLIFFAVPANALPMANSVIEQTITGLRPKVSARAPNSGITAVLARAYEEPIQTNLSPPFRSLVIVGRTVPMAVRSSAPRVIETTIAVKENQNALPLPFFVALAGDSWGMARVTSDIVVWKVTLLRQIYTIHDIRVCDMGDRDTPEPEALYLLFMAGGVPKLEEAICMHDGASE
jgi:hypothetical protein